MKKVLFLILVIGVSLTACQKPQITVQKQNVADSTDNWGVNITYPLFSSTGTAEEKACFAVNDTVFKFIDQLQRNLKMEADTFFGLFADSISQRPPFSYQLYIEDSVFMATDNYISLRLTIYTFEGGAHGMTNYCAFNYDVKKGKFLMPEDIIDYTKAEEINSLLAKYFDNTENCFTEIPTLTNGFTALTISPESMCFTYPQYSLGAYACGMAMVTIPDKELQRILKI